MATRPETETPFKSVYRTLNTIGAGGLLGLMLGGVLYVSRPAAEPKVNPSCANLGRLLLPSTPDTALTYHPEDFRYELTTNLQSGNNPPGSWAYGDLFTVASQGAQAWRIVYINGPGFDPVRRTAGFTPLQGDFAEMNYFTTYAGNDMTRRQILSGFIEYQTRDGNWCIGAKVTAILNPAGR